MDNPALVGLVFVLGVGLALGLWLIATELQAITLELKRHNDREDRHE